MHTIETARLDDIVRQQDPRLKIVVEQLSRGEVQHAVEELDRQGRIHEIPNREERLRAIAQEYVRDPSATLVVSPDNLLGGVQAFPRCARRLRRA
jgi:hypothetical protein